MDSKVLQTIVEIAGNVSPTLGKAVEETCGKLEKVNVKALAVGAAAAAGAVAVGKGAIVASKYLVDLGSQFDGVTDAIRVGTGATGEELDALVSDFDAVYSSVPTSMEDASKAIADYNTRLGLTGEHLQGVSAQAIQVADMLDEDLGKVIESSSEAFQQWNIDAEDMGGAMDYAFKVSQSTGLGFSDLLTTVQKFGPQLQEMGYSFEEATTLIGQMEKAGVNTEEVLAAMKKGVASFAADGLSAAEGLDIYADKIMNAKDMTEATAIASEVFGTKAASTMAAAIRDGSIAVDDLTSSLLENGETISGCAADTYDYAEQMQIFKQKAEVALKPLAATMFDSLNKLMPIVGTLMDSLIPVIENLSATLVPIIEDTVAQLAPMIAELVPPIANIVGSIAGQLIPPLVEIISSILPVIIQLAQMLLPIIELIASSVLPAVVKIIQALLPALMKIISAILPVITDLLNTLLPILMQLIDAILPVIISLIDALLPIVMQIINSILPVIVQLLNTLLPVVIQIINAVLPVIISLLNMLLPIITQLIDAVLPILVSVLNLLTPILDMVIALLMPILDLFLMLIEPILNLILLAIQPLIAIITVLLDSILTPLISVIQVVASVFTERLQSAIANIQPIIAALTGVFSGLIDFIQNVFAGNWKGAWDSVVKIFSNVFAGIKAAFKAPINFIIDGINTFLKGLNKLKIPDWVPGVGGKSLSIPLIPKLAEGGFTDGISIAGEAGMEAVISFDPAFHDENVGYWMQAGKLLGVLDDMSLTTGAETATAATIQLEEAEEGAIDSPLIVQAGKLMGLEDFSLGQLTETTIIYYDFSGFMWAPKIEGATESEKADILEALKEQASEFFDWLEEWLRQKEVGDYDRVGIY